METSVVRQRVLELLRQARRPEADRRADRRAQTDQATQEFDTFLKRVAVPLFKQLADVLRAEGHKVDLFTPGSSVRLMGTRGNDEYIEVVLDTRGTAPKLLGRTSHVRGGDITQTELVLNATANISALTDDDLLGFLLSELDALL
jgi:hypothetical protein